MSPVLLVLGLLVLASPPQAHEIAGSVTFRSLPVPGATIVATQGERRVVTTSDHDGTYRLRDLTEGAWTIDVEMTGFVPHRHAIVLPSARPSLDLELATIAPVPAARVPAPPPATVSAPRRPPPRDDPGEALPVEDSFVVDGSVNNAAASPFAQPRAFGNNRPQTGPRYSGSLALNAGHARWDARPYSLAGEPAARPSYVSVRTLATLGGPLRRLGVRNPASRFFVGYQGVVDETAAVETAFVATPLERRGDFSQTIDASGRAVRPRDPMTGLPFADARVPAGRISPQAAALLALYPEPNVDGGDRGNYQRLVASRTRRHDTQGRWNHVAGRNLFAGTLSYQHVASRTTSVLGFESHSGSSGFDIAASWIRRVSNRLGVRIRPQVTRQASEVASFFGNRFDVAGDAGFAGHDPDPASWGPPRLIFRGIAGLADARPESSAALTYGGSLEAYLNRGRHNITIGGGVRRSSVDQRWQEDPRGTLLFTGAFTGSSVADFLLGLPTASAIGFGHADKRFRAYALDAYVNDDARLTPTVTLTFGVRWEFESPSGESDGRLVNLDVAPGFQAVSPVGARAPRGTLTGRTYGSSLLEPDWSGFQPRLALAWRPVPGSSLVVRAGYGVYRNTGVYLPIARLLAQQPPLARVVSALNGGPDPFTLADAFTRPDDSSSTFAVDPEFRVGFLHNWQASVQRDLPAALLVVATYFGSQGSRLMQQSLPNTHPPGADDPCPACPSGFVYLTSTGRSSRHAGRVLLRRRLRDGLAASVQYTVSRATDDASAFGAAGIGGGSVAQDWRNRSAERAPSSFDQRHHVVAQFEYTTGAGRRASSAPGWRAWLRDWTVASEITAGSGLPFTPTVLVPIPGTTVLGLRPELTGAPVDARRSDRAYANPDAYRAPAPGQWGNTPRNSLRGPALFTWDASLSRSTPIGNRQSVEWRLEVTNVLNRVGAAGVNAVVGSPQFGLPSRANPMRRIHMGMRFRF